ncbi:MAG: sigma-54-dependent transcriptional regulator [Gammaproteobacteria bacterium]
MISKHILVVDDEPEILSLLKEILEEEGFDVALAENAEHARKARRARRPDLTLLDIWLPDTDGIELLKEWAEGSVLDNPVIVMSGHGTVETAVEATRLGAYDFIEKPLSTAKLLLTIRRALEVASLRWENIGLQRASQQALEEPIGTHPAIAGLREQVQKMAAHNTPALITGEPGSGKEVFARYLHRRSARASSPFVAVGVAGLAAENPALEVFGSEEGNSVHYGFLERANGGTLFLKDVADLDQNMQARLLSALENSMFLRVGGREPVAVDVRVIGATRRDLLADIQAGHFRDDLYYHLNVVPLQVPALRAHAQDIPALLAFYIERFGEQEGLPRRTFTARAIHCLCGYRWPGNVRELKNLVQRALILVESGDIDSGEIESALGLSQQGNPPQTVPGLDRPLREAREMFERAYLEYHLQISAGSVSKVAERAGMERTHLYRKLRILGLDPKQVGK